jgi:hexosaminidase
MKDPRDVEYMIFPRALALAEVVWTPQEKRTYSDFTQRLPGQLARLQKEGVNVRPLSGAAPAGARAAAK